MGKGSGEGGVGVSLTSGWGNGACVSAKGGLKFHSSKPGIMLVLGSVKEIFPYISKNLTTVLLPDTWSVMREVYRLGLLFFNPIISLRG